MEDAVDTGKVETFLCEIEACDVEAGRVLFLQGRVVVVGEAVDADDVVAHRLQGVREMGADEPGGSCDDVSHREGEVNRAV